MSNTTHVAVAVIVNDNNEVCISFRHQNSHQGGLWEFPGGKVEPNETIEQALQREIKEELDLDIKQSRKLITIWHDYHDRKVCLHVRKVLSYQGCPRGVEGQEVKWVAISSLSDFDFPAANLPIISALQFPDKYLITGKFNDLDDFTNKLKNALGRGVELVQLRLKEGSLKDVMQTQALVESAAQHCKQAGAKLLLNLSVDNLTNTDLSAIDFSGFHADSRMLNTITTAARQKLTGCKLFSASCHNAADLKKAALLKADFVVLSPVQKTASHPDMDAMGWQVFAELVEKVSIPVYALGGVSGNDIVTSWEHGGQGVSAISAFWE